MAQTVILTDDLNGEGNASEVNFALDGIEYTVDLTEENAEIFRNILEPYIVAGKRVGGRARRGTVVNNNGETKKIREWAKEQGLEVSERGRISAEVITKYREHQKQQQH